MSSIAPSSMFVSLRPAAKATSYQGPSRTAAAALLAFASLPAVVFGGRPLETMRALAQIVSKAVSDDFSAK